MANHAVETFLLLCVCLSAFADVDETITRIQGPCGLTEQQKAVARDNVLEVLAEKNPGLSTYCETETANNFTIVNGVCRTHVSCLKTVDGVDVLRGDSVVELDENTQRVRKVIDATWENKP